MPSIMAGRKRPLPFPTEPTDDNVGPRPLHIPSVLITDAASALTGPRTREHSFIACTFSSDANYPDPYLEGSFECAYHDQLPPPDPLDDLDAESGHVDKKQDAQGYRSTHHGCAKFTSSDIASLRIIRLEASNNEVSVISSFVFKPLLSAPIITKFIFLEHGATKPDICGCHRPR